MRAPPDTQLPPDAQVDDPLLSIVVPVHDEAETVASLSGEIDAALAGTVAFEIIFVDDASTDDTPARLLAAAACRPHLRVLRHQRNSGQSRAVVTGVRHARGAVIATLDGDGQNDPSDLALLWQRWQAERTADRRQPMLLAGWRTQRRDTVLRRWSSRVANGVRGRLLGDATPDTGCGLKMFDRDLFLRLPCFDHMHRFLPALVLRDGGRVVSVPVGHRPRRHGRSHYGVWNRLWVGLVDIAGVAWLKRRLRLTEVTEVTEVTGVTAAPTVEAAASGLATEGPVAPPLSSSREQN